MTKNNNNSNSNAKTTKASSSSTRRRRSRRQQQESGGDNDNDPPKATKTTATKTKRGRTRGKSATTNNNNDKDDDDLLLLSSLPSSSSYWWHANNFLSPSIIPAVKILILAIITGVLYNRWTSNENDGEQQGGLRLPVAADPNTAAFIHKICSDSSVFCHSNLVPSGRTQAVVVAATHAGIPKGEITLRIPRKYQIWDMDALQSNWTKRNGLLKARLKGGNNTPLSSAAYLAAYLAMLRNKQSQKQQSGSTTDDDEDEPINDILQDYVSILPTYDDYMKFHPILWSKDELHSSGLAPSSSTYEVIASLRDLLYQEYHAFSMASPADDGFAKQISREDYLAARLNVQTRAFGTGPISVAKSEQQLINDEAGIDLSKNGCFAMVPILDLYDHHANPHVAFEYKQHNQKGDGREEKEDDNGAFVIKAITDIPSSYQVFDSYGKRTDSDLFARYGFVNGDGTDYTEASIAALHSIKRNVVPIGVDDNDSDGDEGTNTGSTTTTTTTTGESSSNTLTITRSLLQSPLARQLVHYMQYDDGYEQCVSPDADTSQQAQQQAWKFKLLKFKYLLTHSQIEKSWVIQFHPRNKDGKPPPPSDYIADPNSGKKKGRLLVEPPPSFDPNQLKFNATRVLSTCRLLSLTHRDYNGQATLWLKLHMNDPDAILPVDEKDDSLEFRTLLRAAQLASTAQSRFRTTVEEQYERVAQLQKQQQDDGSGSKKSREWMVQYLILGEMQGLQALKEVAFSKLRTTYGHIIDKQQAKDESLASAYHVRERPCPKDLLPSLIEHALKELD